MNKFAEMFSLYIKVNNIHLRDIEAETGINKASLSRFCRGKSLTAGHFLALLNWLMKEGV